MKADLLDKLERLEKKATPGPWEATKCGPGVWRGPLEENSDCCVAGADKTAGPLFEVDPFDYSDRSRSEEGAERLALRDCRFIAAMRNTFAELIMESREAERLRGERDEAIRILVGLVCDGGDHYIRKAHDLIGKHPEIQP